MVYIKLLFSIFFLLGISQIEKFLAPTNHYAYYPNLFNDNRKNAFVSLICRLLIIALTTLLFFHILQLDACIIIFIVALTQFIIELPKIYNYKLFKMFNSKLRLFGMIECLLSVIISTLISLAILNRNNIYCLAIFIIILLLFLVGNYSPLTKRKTVYNYPLEDAYLDKYITYRNLSFEKINFSKKYNKILKNSGKKYNLDPVSIQTIISLERYHRNGIFYRFLEFILIGCFPSFLEKNNSTLGYGQASIKSIKAYYGKLSRKILFQAMKPENNIDICAFCLRKIIDSFFIEYNDGFYVDDEDSLTAGEKLEAKILSKEEILWNYVASKYLTGFTLSRIKCVVVYTSFLTEVDINKCLTNKQKEKLKELEIK